MVDVKDLLLHMPTIVDALCMEGALDDEVVRRLESAIDCPDIINYKLCLLAKDLVFDILEIESRCRALRGTMVAMELFWRSRGRSGNLLGQLEKQRAARRSELARVCRVLIRRAPVEVKSDTREDKARRAVMQEFFLEIRQMKAEYLRDGAPLQRILPFEGDDWRAMQNEAIRQELAREPFRVTEDMARYFREKDLATV